MGVGSTGGGLALMGRRGDAGADRGDKGLSTVDHATDSPASLKQQIQQLNAENNRLALRIADLEDDLADWNDDFEDMWGERCDKK